MKFSIRDVLLGTAIAALIIGWWLDRTRLATQVQSTGSDTIQLVVAGKDQDEFVLFNPRTGETWKRYSNGKWITHSPSLAESLQR